MILNLDIVSNFVLRASNFRFRKNQSGFTLIELLVVTTVIAMIAGISVANFRGGEKQKRAQIAADTVINAVRNAQNFMLAGKNTNNSNLACRVPQYYFITFSYQNPAVLSALNNNTGVCGTTPDTIETYTLPANTTIEAQGLILDSAIAATNLTIVFYPPFGAMKAAIDGNDYNPFTAATISVQTTDGAVIKTATVDGIVGRIGE